MGAVLNSACSLGWCQPENDSLPCYPVIVSLICLLPQHKVIAHHVAHTGLWCQHVWHKLQIHNPWHIPVLGHTSPTAPTNIILSVGTKCWTCHLCSLSLGRQTITSNIEDDRISNPSHNDLCESSSSPFLRKAAVKHKHASKWGQSQSLGFAISELHILFIVV